MKHYTFEISYKRTIQTMYKFISAIVLICSMPFALGQTFVSGNSFQTPSGNIACTMEDATSLRCDLMSQTNPRPPKPVDCPVDYGGAYALQAKGKAAILCHGDTIFNPSYPKLPYGTTWSNNGILCESKQTGLTCKNFAGRGFFLSKANQQLF
jgi:hypothetical protein